MNVTFGSKSLRRRATTRSDDGHVRSLQHLAQVLKAADSMWTIQALTHYRLSGGPEEFKVRLVGGGAKLRLVLGGVEIVKAWRT